MGEPAEPPAPSDYRLSMVFMAAAPRGRDDLNYEAEEAAILAATGSIGLDLTVEESGALRLLGDCVANETRESPLDVLHLSCHGTLDPEPSLLLEDEEGEPQFVHADQLAGELGGNVPRLLFLSACETASPDQVLGSMAFRMIARGTPAVLGWGAPVRDSEATRFAAELAQRLARHEPLEEAAARARYELLHPPEVLSAGQAASRDWHLARLFLGPKGGGTLCRGTRARHRRDVEHVTRVFLDERDQRVPVASAREFVGRRRQMQAVLRAFRQRTGAGVLVHGMGNQGKSSLAARVAHRMYGYSLVVLHGQYDARTILETISRFLGSQAVRDLAERFREPVEKDSSSLEAFLRELLEGPCSQVPSPGGTASHDSPILLVMDDFEKALEPAAGGEHRVESDLIPATRAVFRAFGDASTASRLLLTSRYTFAIEDDKGRDLASRLTTVQLPPMEEYEGKKQVLAKIRVSPVKGATADTRRTERIVRAAQGNPGLQDLLFSISLEDAETCDAALEAMEEFLGSGRVPGQERLVGFLENLALDALIGRLATGDRQLLRASALFGMPVPVEIAALVADALGVDAGKPCGRRLFGLGLWEAFEDWPEGHRLACAINALARPKVDPLSEEERASLSRIVVEPLFEKWGSAEGRKGRPYSADHELAQLALLAGDREVLAVVAEDAVLGLARRFNYRTAAELGRRSITCLDEAGDAVSLGLLRATGEQCHRTGDVQTARALYERAAELLGGAPPPETPETIEGHAALLISHARLLAQSGQIDEALGIFEEAGKLLADDRFRRERAVTLGDIARIRVSKGQVDEALKLHEEELKVYEELGDLDGKANTLWSIAQIDLQRKDYQAAYERLAESYSINLKLGRLDGICFVGLDLGQLLCAAGQKEDGLKILARSRDGFQQLGQEELVRRVAGLIEQAEARQA